MQGTLLGAIEYECATTALRRSARSSSGRQADVIDLNAGRCDPHAQVARTAQDHAALVAVFGGGAVRLLPGVPGWGTSW